MNNFQLCFRFHLASCPVLPAVLIILPGECICIVSGKSLLFLGNISIFGLLGKQMKLQDEDKILGRNGKCINYMGKLNAKSGKQC